MMVGCHLYFCQRIHVCLWRFSLPASVDCCAVGSDAGRDVGLNLQECDTQQRAKPPGAALLATKELWIDTYARTHIHPHATTNRRTQKGSETTYRMEHLNTSFWHLLQTTRNHETSMWNDPTRKTPTKSIPIRT